MTKVGIFSDLARKLSALTTMSKKLDSVKGNLTKTWKVLNAITSRHTQSSVVDEIVYNN